MDLLEEDTDSGLQADLPCGMKHGRRGSLVLWIGLDCDKGAAAVLRMGEGGFHPWMWVARHPGDTQLSSQTQVYHIGHHVESAWAPYVYRHVLISLFLSQNTTFVKLQGVIIIRNNANFHTKKKKTYLSKRISSYCYTCWSSSCSCYCITWISSAELHLLRMAAAVISIWVQVYGERTFCFSGVTLLRSTCLRPYIT